MSSAQQLFSALRRLLAEANELVDGDPHLAGAKCQEASSVVMQLADLCHNQPHLQAEAEPLFEQLKQTVHRVKRRSGASKSSTPAAAAWAASEDAAAAAMDDNPFSERNVLKSFRLKQEQELQHMKSREVAMDQLAKDMIALDEIFTSLNKMVHEQSEGIQLIEDRVENVEIEVVKGEEQLADAVVQKKSGRKKKIIIIVIVVAAVLLLALILYLVLSKVL